MKSHIEIKKFFGTIKSWKNFLPWRLVLKVNLAGIFEEQITCMQGNVRERTQIHEEARFA